MKLITAIAIGVLGLGCGNKKPDIAASSGKISLEKDGENTVSRSDDLVALVRKYYRALAWDGWPREEWLSMFKKARSIAPKIHHIAGTKFLEAVGFTFTNLHNGLHQIATDPNSMGLKQLVHFPSSWIKLLTAARFLVAANENVKDRDTLLNLAADLSDRVSTGYHSGQNRSCGARFDTLFTQCTIRWQHDRCLDEAHLLLTGRSVLMALYHAYMSQEQRHSLVGMLNSFDTHHFVQALSPAAYDNYLALMKTVFTPIKSNDDLNGYIEETILGSFRIPRETYTNPNHLN